MNSGENRQQELEHQQWLEEGHLEYEEYLDKNGYFNGWSAEMEKNFNRILGESDGN